MRRNTVTDLLRAEAPRPRTADMGFVLSVMQAIEKRRLYAQVVQLGLAGLAAVLILAAVAPWVDVVVSTVLPALPVLMATASGLFLIYMLRRKIGLFS
jgi:hypothetical protein